MAGAIVGPLAGGRVQRLFCLAGTSRLLSAYLRGIAPHREGRGGLGRGPGARHDGARARRSRVLREAATPRRRTVVFP
jgi:hypothetical protein